MMYSPMGNSREGHVRAVAQQVLRDARVTVPEVPVQRLVGDHGLAITACDIPRGWGYFDPTAWAIRLAPGIMDETPANRNRRRFTLAHELGHCLLEHGEASCWNLGIAAEPSDLGEEDDFPDFEREAHHFARELLLPRPWLARDWAVNPNPEQLAKQYGVSRETLFIVLIDRRLLMRPVKRRR